MTESEIINELLRWYAMREGEYPIEVTGESGLIHTKAKNKMIAYNLIELRGRHGFYFLTEVGYAAYKAGSFDKWLKENEQKADELHRATLATAKATVDAAESAKWSKYAAIISAGAAIVAFLIPSLIEKYSTTVIPKSDSAINALEKKVDTIYWQLKDQSKSLKDIKDSTQRQKMKQSALKRP